MFVKSAYIATCVSVVTAACANRRETVFLPSDNGLVNSTSLSPSYAMTNSASYGKPVDANALLWTTRVNDILVSKVINDEQPLSDVVCFFSVNNKGKIVDAVRFSRSLNPDLAKKITDNIMHASPLPIPGGTARKIYFEIARNGDTCVGFAK
ncbi:MAG: hypothetical protein P4L53_26825 [Candidatus Obscuribacterales bacterium]|nr:hypothetical protein [Candidatus Obscuribacterales bacterium]